MTPLGILSIAVFFLVVLALTRPLGAYMARVYQGERTWLDPVLVPVERVIYRAAGSTGSRSRAGGPTPPPCCCSTCSACC